MDPQRPLSPRGLEHASRLAADAASRGVKPAVVWHSGKLRARQTAEAMWRACNPLAEFVAARGLQPGDTPDEIVGRVAGETRDIMLVGHMPNLPRVLEALTRGRNADARAEFPTHGLVALDAVGDAWVEKWRMD
ncbi:MAG TPA: histidine phosphatase family protein [Vicinamibacterales bacterium]|nr:histidine phosphatase family protein [Vicinamibacterales bacterium]